MFAELNQDSLDVKTKTRSNAFNWRGQFTPDFVKYILDRFANSDSVVIDPFSGSGTVLHECAKKNITAYGFEINPAAYSMSKFFSFSNLSPDIREKVISAVKSKILDSFGSTTDLKLVTDDLQFSNRYANLTDYAKSLFANITDKHESILALNVLFETEKSRHKGLNTAVLSSFDYVSNLLLNLPHAQNTIDANLADARRIHEISPQKANLIFTSPPYINVFNYHQNYRAVLETLGWDLLRVAHSEFGSNRKNRGNRFKTVIQYCIDMEQAIASFWECLADEGLLILVVGRTSNVRKTPFYNGEIVTDLIKAMGSFSEPLSYERKFLNKFGDTIKEDIIIVKKTASKPNATNAREIASQHLQQALLNPCEVDVKTDLEDALNCLSQIVPSPLFKGNEVNSYV